MFSCVLRPLRAHLDKALVMLHRRDESSRRFSRSLSRLRGQGAAERLGLRAGVPDGRQVGEVKRKLELMRHAHSPVDKLLLLLQVCKCVQKALGATLGERRPAGSRRGQRGAKLPADLTGGRGNSRELMALELEICRSRDENSMSELQCCRFQVGRFP